MVYLLYLIFGILPSIIWLLFYLRKDVHPEPNYMVIKIFIWGMLATLPTILIELGTSSLFSLLSKLPLSSLFYYLFCIALPEEMMKYLVVKDKVLKSSELDEPTDVILYCIIAALGFAAFENSFFLIFYQLQFLKIVLVASFRFLGAVFLHALCSGILGYFLAYSFYQPKKELFHFFSGISLSVLLHGFFNFFIIKIGQTVGTSAGEISFFSSALLAFYLIGIVSILLGSAIFLSLGFKRLKKLQGLCEIVK